MLDDMGGDRTSQLLHGRWKHERKKENIVVDDDISL